MYRLTYLYESLHNTTSCYFMNSLGIVTALKKILPIFKRSFKEKSYVLCYSIFPKWQVVFFISVILLSFSIRFMSVLKNLAGIFPTSCTFLYYFLGLILITVGPLRFFILKSLTRKFSQVLLNCFRILDHRVHSCTE